MERVKRKKVKPTKEVKPTKVKVCPFCKKEFSSRRNNKKFCSRDHRVNYNARKFYLANKNSPRYKNQTKVRVERWRKNNRVRFNKLVGKAMARYNAKKRKKKREGKKIKNG